MTRILDLDLDFFLDNVSHRHVVGRLPSDDFRPWSGDAVRTFLEKQCQLTQKERTPGFLAETHDRAFFWWRSLIQEEKLEPPFDVVHVDAHADLGFGVGGWEYLMGDILHKPIDGRYEPEEGDDRLNQGNYLLFAVACRWIRSLTYVHHPKSGQGEYLPWTFSNSNPSSGRIELKAATPESISEMLAVSRDTFELVTTEPPVTFHRIAGNQFCAQAPFDFVFICQSPTYTPLESDELLPVIREYVYE